MYCNDFVIHFNQQVRMYSDDEKNGRRKISKNNLKRFYFVYLCYLFVIALKHEI